MAFRVPTMPLLCNIYNGPPPLNFLPRPVPRLANVPCQLRYLKNSHAEASTLGRGASPMLLLVNAGTDVRMQINGSQMDYVECPAGSRRLYLVDNVDDVAKGFANEYRAVAMTSIGSGTLNIWPTPYP